MSFLEQLSVIIPVGPGETELAALLPDLAALPAATEVLAAGPVPQELGERVRWITSEKGRARQLNAGARAAQRTHLLFLHADSRIPSSAFQKLERSLAARPDALHFFNMKFRDDGPRLTRLNTFGVWIKSHWMRTAFGDQGFCIRRDLFERLGGFDENVPFGEDHYFLRNASRKGVPLRCAGGWISTSARKYRERGWLRTTASHVIETIRQAREASRGAVAAFVKTPGLSPIKTRLAASLGENATADFYKLSLEASGALLRKSPLVPYWAVAEDAGLRSPLWKEFARIHQGDGPLGDRLHRIYSELLRRHPFALLIGSDSPQLSPKALARAGSALRSHDFILGRAHDGGFYLFGGRKEIPAEVWRSIPYSAAETADRLRRALEPLGSVAEIPALPDIDTIEDLMRFRDLSPALASALLPEQQALRRWAKTAVKPQP